MPNWCSNRAVISNPDQTKMIALVEAINDSKFCNHVIPVPESLHIVAGKVGSDEDQNQQELYLAEQANQALHGYKNWYDFCVSEWGTKWDVDPYDKVELNEDGSVEFCFDSAWAPPVGVYEALVEQGYDVVATYYEPGMAYVGRFDNGIDDCIEYGEYTSDTVREVIGEELDDEYGISESMAEYEDEENAED